jgi:hypothetical protein
MEDVTDGKVEWGPWRGRVSPAKLVSEVGTDGAPNMT